MLDTLLGLAAARGASDLHLSSGQVPMLRLHGELVATDQAPLSAEALAEMLAHAIPDPLRARYRDTHDVDFALESGGRRFRANAYRILKGPAAAFRLVADKAPALADIGAPAVLTRLAELPRGLVLVTGPTGSGKSTTLAAMVDHINRHHARHIVTIEDPVEVIHESRRSLVSQREVGAHTASFASALRAALREDPDVILVGEMRDPETIQLALTAAETGHLVLGTLHTASAAKAVDRIVDVFPGPAKDMARTMLAGSLQAVVAQALLRRADGGGRLAAHEVLVATPAVRALVRENKVPQIASMIQMGARFGMQSMADGVNALVRSGKVLPDEAAHVLAAVEDGAKAGMAVV